MCKIKLKTEIVNFIKTGERETPYFLYDLQSVRSQIESIKKAFSSYENFQLFYAVKANSSELILKEIKKQDIGIAASSLQELRLAKKLKFRKISYTAPFVVENEIPSEVELNFNNLSELKNSGRKNIGLRINPEIGWSFVKAYCAGEKGSQLGIPYDEAMQADLSKISRLHMHTSSDCYDVNIFISALERILKIAEKFSNINTINIGGGIAVPILKNDELFDINSFAEKIIEKLNRFNIKNKRKLLLQMEPGNYIVRQAGYYICKVFSADKKGETQFFFANGTMHHLRGLSMIEKIDFISNAKKTGSGALCGCTCQRSDIIYQSQKMPSLRTGDLAVVSATGAYCMTQADNFHLLEKPKEYFLN